MARAPYRERAYRALSARLRASSVPCWRCGRRALTVDHVPALALHDHRPGTRCCELRPACAQCNYGTGARLARRAHRTGTPTSRPW